MSFSYFSFVFMKIVLKNNYICRMIKNKTLNIEIIFKIYLKILKMS